MQGFGIDKNLWNYYTLCMPVNLESLKKTVITKYKVGRQYTLWFHHGIVECEEGINPKRKGKDYAFARLENLEIDSDSNRLLTKWRCDRAAGIFLDSPDRTWNIIETIDNFEEVYS
jgi:hypothetical protein